MKRKPEQTSDKLKQQQYQNELLKKFVVGTLAPIARDGMVRTLKTGGDKNKGKMGAYISGVIYMNSKDAGIPDQSAYQAAMTAADNLVPAVKAVQAQVSNMKTRNPFIKFDELLHNVSDFITNSAIHGPGSEQMNQEQKDYIKKKSKGDIIVKTLEPFVQKQQLKGGAEPINDENEINLSWLTDDDDFIGKLKGGISFWESPWNWVKEKFGYETDQQQAARERLEEEQARQLDREEYARRDHAYDSHGVDRAEQDYNLQRLMQKRAMEANQPGVLKKTWNAIKESVKAHPIRWALGAAGLVAAPFVLPKVAGMVLPSVFGASNAYKEQPEEDQAAAFDRIAKEYGYNPKEWQTPSNKTPKGSIFGNIFKQNSGKSPEGSTQAEENQTAIVPYGFDFNKVKGNMGKTQPENPDYGDSIFGSIFKQFSDKIPLKEQERILKIERDMYATSDPRRINFLKRQGRNAIRNLQKTLVTDDNKDSLLEQIEDLSADWSSIVTSQLATPPPKTWSDTAKEWSGVWMPMATKLGSKVMTSMGMKDDEAQQLANQIGDFAQNKINQGMILKQQQRAATIQNLQQREFLKEKQHFHREMMEKQQKLHNEQQKAYQEAVLQEKKHKNEFDKKTLEEWEQVEKKAREADNQATKKAIQESQKLLKTFFDKHREAKEAFEKQNGVKISEETWGKWGLAGFTDQLNGLLTSLKTFFNGDTIGATAKQEFDDELKLKLLEIQNKYPPVNMELLKRKFELEHQYTPLINLDLFKEQQEQEKQRLQTQIKHEEGMMDTIQQQEVKQVAIPLTTPIHMPSSSAKISVTPISMPDLNVVKELQQNQQAVSVAPESQPTEANMPTYVNAGPNRKTKVVPITVSPMIPQTYTPVNREQQLSQILTNQSASIMQRLPHSMQLEMMPLEQKGKIAATALSATTAAAATAALGGTPVQIALSAMKPVADAIDSKSMKTAISTAEKFGKERKKE